MVRIKSIEEIQNFTCFIRSLRKGLITNFYLNVEKHSIWIETGEFFVHETPECIFFLHENGNFYHLFFTATSTDSLCAALQKASFCNELVSVSAILSCRPFFILIFLPYIKMRHYGFSRKSIWKNLETFP